MQFHDLDSHASIPLYVEEEDYYTPEWALSEEEMARMTMPSGDSPEDAQSYYDYLLAHHQNDGRIATWHVDWVSLAWMYGFVVALALLVLLWVWQYRTTLDAAPWHCTRSTASATTSSEEARPVSLVLPRPHARADPLRGGAHRRPPDLGADLLMASARPSVRLVLLGDRGRRPGERLGGRVRLAADAQGPRPGVSGLPALRRLHPRRDERRRASPLLHDVGHALAARGIPRARLHARAPARRLRRASRPERSLVMEKVF